MPQRTIRDIIENQELLTASADTTVGEAACLMKQRHVGAVMVVEDGKLVGVFTERDALFRVVAEGRDSKTTPLAEVMTREPKTVDPAQSFAYALRIMYDGGFRHVPVVEDGKPIGVVSVRDALGPELEAIVYELLLRGRFDEVLA